MEIIILVYFAVGVILTWTFLRATVYEKNPKLAQIVFIISLITMIFIVIHLLKVLYSGVRTKSSYIILERNTSNV